MNEGVGACGLVRLGILWEVFKSNKLRAIDRESLLKTVPRGFESPNRTRSACLKFFLAAKNVQGCGVAIFGYFFAPL